MTVWLERVANGIQRLVIFREGEFNSFTRKCSNADALIDKQKSILLSVVSQLRPVSLSWWSTTREVPAKVQI